MADTQTSTGSASSVPAEPTTQDAPAPKPKPAATRSRGRARPGRARSARAEPARTIFGRRRVRARRVRRTIRHIDPWSVFKIAVLFCLCLYGAMLIASALLWRAAIETGLIGNVESFFVEIGLFDELEFNGEVLFRAVSIGGFVLAVASAAGIVLMTVVFNLISDVMGGIRVSVIEEDIAYVRPNDANPAEATAPPL